MNKELLKREYDSIDDRQFHYNYNFNVAELT